MKTLYLLLLLFLLFFINNTKTFGQTYIGTIGGVTVSKLHFSYNGSDSGQSKTISNYNNSYDYDKGYTIGMSFQYFSNSQFFSFQIDSLYITKNSVGIGTQTKNKYFTSWIELPILAKWHPLKSYLISPFVGCGIYNSFLTNAEKKLPDESRVDASHVNFNPSLYTKDQMSYSWKKYEIGPSFVLGMNYFLPKTKYVFSTEIRYEFGLNNLSGLKDYKIWTDSLMLLFSASYKLF